MAYGFQAAERGGGGNAAAADRRGKERRWGLTSMALRNAEKPKTFRNRHATLPGNQNAAQDRRSCRSCILALGRNYIRS